MVSGDSAPEGATIITVKGGNKHWSQKHWTPPNYSSKQTCSGKTEGVLADESPPSALYQVVTSTHTASKCNQVQSCSCNINTAARYFCLTPNRDPEPEPPTTVAAYTSWLGHKVLLL